MQVVIQRKPEVLAAASPDTPGRVAALIVGSDQGMCGQFNSRIVSHTLERLRDATREPHTPLLVAVGSRTVAELEAHRRPVSEALRLPGSVSEITTRVEELLLKIDQWRRTQDVHRVWLFHQRPMSGASYRPHFQQVMPLGIDWLTSLRNRAWPTRMLPTFTMDWQTLLSALIRQYLFTALFQALAESLAAENAARLAAMQAAESNIEERLDELTARYHRQRQNAITEELLDVTAGFEVLERP